MRRREFVDALQAFGEHGVGERRQYDADQARALAAQLAAERARAEVEGVDRLTHFFEGDGVDRVRRVDRTGDGRNRKARVGGDILDGRRHRWVPVSLCRGTYGARSVVVNVFVGRIIGNDCDGSMKAGWRSSGARMGSIGVRAGLV